MRLIILIAMTLTSMNAYAYVGPGLGLGVIGAFLGGILAVLLALAGVIWYPVKRMIKKKKAARPDDAENTPDDQEHQEKDEVDQSNKA